MSRVRATLSACLVALVFTATASGCSPTAETSYDGLSNGDATGSATPTETDAQTPRPIPVVRLELAWSEFRQPLHVASAGDNSGRLFVVEKTGRIIVIDPTDDRTTYLDLSDVVSTDSERGVLSVAFETAFPTSRRLYVDYTRADGTTVVSRFTERDGRADPDSEEVLLTVAQPYSNHNGGQLAFGHDGYLYVSLGDGGSGGDPQDHGQDPFTLLGTVLRLDVSADQGYSIPPDNPFIDGGGAPEVWAYGLRNPWRMTFDSETGDLWIGDVGQGAWEEIDVLPAGSGGGQNYGWRVWEGAHLYAPDDPRPKDPVDPVHEYGRDAGVSVTGGFVYRGDDIPDLLGWYVFGDYGSGAIWGLDADSMAEDGPPHVAQLFDTDLSISSFGVDESGELYVVDLSSGGIYRVAGDE